MVDWRLIDKLSHSLSSATSGTVGGNIREAIVWVPMLFWFEGFVFVTVYCMQRFCSGCTGR